MISTNDFKIDVTGSTDVTEKLQSIIDLASEKKEMLRIEAGTYLVSALYLKTNLKIYFKEGAIIKGIQDEEKYHLINTRVAGIDMPWYPAILNIIDAKNVHIYGSGTILGAGEYWYKKYWGEDMKGGMRKAYDLNNLRWACDYECKRVRNMLVSNSSDIIINGIKSIDSGFWNIHILYSNNVIVNNVIIDSKSKIGPSTDGIDVDSSCNVLIDNSTISTNDDAIAIKSGRDSNGIKKGIPSKNVIIRNTTINEGYGVTIGSEVSGGIENIHICNIKFNGTCCGFRIKSSTERKGYIRNILVENLNMVDVAYPFNINLNWNPAYSIAKMPDSSNIKLSPSLIPLLDRYNEKFTNTKVENITIKNVTSDITDKFKKHSKAFIIEGFDDVKINQVTFDNIKLVVHEYGLIKNITNLNMNNINISVLTSIFESIDSFDNR